MSLPQSVAVLGCGPAGLMAVHAAAVSGVETIHCYSKPRKSEMFGAQYLHAPIPGATTSAPVTVSYELMGTADQYRAKVYGEDWMGDVSPEEFTDPHDAWDIRTTYDELWKMYSPYLLALNLPHDWSALEGQLPNYDLVVSTIPAPIMCRRKEIHTFHARKIWALGDAPERGVQVPYGVAKNTVVCNGLPNPSWYRVSNLFGYSTAEWAHKTKPPISGVGEVSKPLYNNCDCLPDVMRAGRFGKWEKGVLTHHAFQEVMDRCVQ